MRILSHLKNEFINNRDYIVKYTALFTLFTAYVMVQLKKNNLKRKRLHFSKRKRLHFSKRKRLHFRTLFPNFDKRI